MGWPQVSIIVLAALTGGLHLAKDGQPRTDRHSFGWWLVNSAILFGLLYAGGFFS